MTPFRETSVLLFSLVNSPFYDFMFGSLPPCILPSTCLFATFLKNYASSLIGKWITWSWQIHSEWHWTLGQCPLDIQAPAPTSSTIRFSVEKAELDKRYKVFSAVNRSVLDSNLWSWNDANQNSFSFLFLCWQQMLQTLTAAESVWGNVLDESLEWLTLLSYSESPAEGSVKFWPWSCRRAVLVEF